MSGAREERFVLSIDLGTGGPKVGLVSLTGSLAWKEHVAVGTCLVSGGGAVQDAARWWEVITDTTRRALASGAVRPEQVVAVCCTGQWSSTVPVGADGVPVGDCVMWMDTRGGPHVREAVGGPVAGYSPLAAARWIQRTGGAPNTEGADPLGHMLLIEREQPDVARETRWYLEPVDYLSMRFTGIAAASPASMLGTWLTDNRKPYQLEYDRTLIGMIGVPEAKLAPLHPTGSVVAEVAPAVAVDLGLPPGVKVVTGIPDLHSAATGSGCVYDYETHLAISTTSWISCPVPFKKTDALRQIASVPGLFPGAYLVVDNQDTSGVCLEWLRDSVLAPDDGLEPPIEISYDALTALAATVPPGSGRVIFTPWLMGQRTPVDDKYARGGFYNLKMRTTRAHLVRAVLEGVAFNNRWLLESVERFVKHRLDPIRIV
ncbi:MAG TPA: FGGY family carbohydrate kinase, partial [Acidimicrobiales bacterium]|nr:FGGY family carbohydrate kinase [Acidimicrobiales bacterium]